MLPGRPPAELAREPAANRAGLQVDNVVYEALMSADSTLRADEKELGVCLADIGAGSTDMIVYSDGMVAHTGVVPVGGDHFTNDVAVGLRTPMVAAEKIKKQFGHTISSRVPEGNEIEVPAVGERPSRLMPQRFLAEILEPRARELFTMLRDNLRQGGVLDALGAGCVLTGGGALLAGLLDNAESLLRVPTRVGMPVPLSRMPPELAPAPARFRRQCEGILCGRAAGCRHRHIPGLRSTTGFSKPVLPMAPATAREPAAWSGPGRD